MSWRLAAMSRRSMRLARETSSAAVSSGTLPISLRYMRTGSLVGVLIERSSAGAASSPSLASAGGLVAFDDVDALVGEEQEDVVDLIGRQVDVLQHVSNVLAGQVALFAALGEQFAHLVDHRLGWLRRPIGRGRINRGHCHVPHAGHRWLSARRDHATPQALGPRVVG